MTRTIKGEQLDLLMEQASEALAKTEYAEAERLADRALHMARSADDFERMARICLPLMEARRQRLQLALDAGQEGGVQVRQSVVPDEVPEPGCYLFQPPLVGADARRLRLAALEADVPVAVICREPFTQLRLCPIVAIGQATVRARIEPPADPEHPDLSWFAHALEQLGDEAIDSVDTGLDLDRQVDALLARLDAVPDHEKLHQALEATCRALDRETRDRPTRGGSRRQRPIADDGEGTLDGGAEEVDDAA
ncbi:MAG: hypothetical protein KDA22_08210 [Phycisphaerales bacterium]|nr:hypothetical protein [Phycisphaerales bacterium]